MPTAPSPALWDSPPRDFARAVFACARDPLLVLDPDRRVVEANGAAAALFGVRAAALAGVPLDDLLDGAPASGPLPAGARLRSGVWVGLTATAVERYTVLAARPEPGAAERFRNVVEGSLQGILIHQDERIRYANPAMARMLGYDGPADLVGRGLWEAVAPPDHVDVLRARTAAIYAGEAVPPHPGWCAVRKDGRRVWVSTAASLIEWDGRPAVAAFYLDISEQKRTEESLRASERFVSAITGASPLTMYVFDRTNGRNVWANRQITDDLGYTPDEVRAMGPDFLARLLHPDDLAQVPALLARWDAARDDDVLVTEYRMRHADGSWRWFVGHDTVFARAPDGRVRQFLGTTLDVTARKRAEEKAARYRDMLETIRHAQAQFLVDRNPASIFEMLLRDLLALTESAYGFIGEVLHTAEGAPYLKTYAITDIAWSDETRRFYGAHAPTGLEFGNLRTLFGAVLTSGEPLIANDPGRDPRRGGLPDGHPALRAFLGLPIHYGDRMVGMVGIANRPAGYDPEIVEYLRPFVATCAQLVEAYRSERQRRAAEDALRGSRALYHSLVANLPVSLFTKDRAGRFLFANERFCEAAGVPLDALIGKTDADLWPADLAAAYRADDLRVMETGAVLEKEEQNRDRHGAPVHVHVMKTPVRDPDGAVIGVQGVFWDVTARTRAEEERRDSEARLRAILESEPECVKLLDRDGRVLEMNAAGLRMIEADAPGDVLGRCVYPIVAPDHRPAFEGLTRAVFRGEPRTLEFEIVGLKGTRRWLDTHASPLRAADGSVAALLSVTRDITERKRADEERQRLEAQVLQAQKLESLGVLAGGIAHDFNNLLTSVLGYSNLAALELGPGSPARAMLAEIEKAAQRAAELTQQMLAYSGRGKFVVRPVALDVLVHEMHKLLQSVVSKKAVIHLELAPATVEADATQLRQVVMNLLTNASDALEGQPGAIAVRTGTRALTADELRSAFVQDAPPAGDYAFLEVADSGCGMTEDTVARVFDPFFTTKFTGRGLGLAAVLGIVRGHRGSLRIDTALGRGTTFSVFLPLAPAAPNPVAAEAAALEPPLRGHGTILWWTTKRTCARSCAGCSPRRGTRRSRPATARKPCACSGRGPARSGPRWSI